MSNRPMLFTTGATGVLGRKLIEPLTKSFSVTALIRANTQQEARKRFEEAVTDKHSEVRVVAGDLLKHNFGIPADTLKEIFQQTTHILHSAASTRFTNTLQDARTFNVETTENVIEFAWQCPKLVKVGHISTAFVAGKRIGRILESEFEHSSGFLNTYEQSKYEAEQFVRSVWGSLPIEIYRPSLVLTEPRKTPGPASAVHVALGFIRKGSLPVLPGWPNSRIDLISANDTAQAISDLFRMPPQTNGVFHIASGDQAPTVQEILESTTKKKLRDLPVEFVGSVDAYQKAMHARRLLRPDIRIVEKKLASFVSEPAYSKIFDTTNTTKTLGRDILNTNPLDVLQETLGIKS